MAISDNGGSDEETETLWLQDFVFNTKRVPCPTILLVGKRFSGKSYTAVSIAQKFKVPRFCAFCGTKDTEDFWAEKFESSASVRGPDEAGKSYLIKVIKYQQRKSRLYKKVLKQAFPVQYQIGFIFDDVTAKREFRKGEILEDLFSNGRHYNAVIIISCQYLKQLPPAVRTNTDYMFLMHNTKRTCKVLYEDFVENPETFASFLELLRSVTGQKDHNGKDLFNSLVYDNVVKSSKIEDMFKVYRNEGIDEINKMLIGSAEWRQYNKDHFKDKDQEMQMREYRKHKRLLRIQEYRQRQMERRLNPEAFVSNDLDYFSDSDSDDEDAKSSHDSIVLGHKRGPKQTINFSKKPRTGGSVESSNQWNESIARRQRNEPTPSNPSNDMYAAPNRTSLTPYSDSLYPPTPYGSAPAYPSTPYNPTPYGSTPYGSGIGSRPSYSSTPYYGGTTYPSTPYGSTPSYTSTPYNSTPNGSTPYGSGIGSRPSYSSTPYGGITYPSTPYDGTASNLYGGASYASAPYNDIAAKPGYGTLYNNRMSNNHPLQDRISSEYHANDVWSNLPGESDSRSFIQQNSKHIPMTLPARQYV